ncbi:unnamed protein product [Effrenium voratum]|nr:unnamed protein product [Effrenium voratum]
MGYSMPICAPSRCAGRDFETHCQRSARKARRTLPQAAIRFANAAIKPAEAFAKAIVAFDRVRKHLDVFSARCVFCWQLTSSCKEPFACGFVPDLRPYGSFA